MLARKWRPQTFADLVGQEHVVKALVNALETDRLHHAYLFTGIRGVGKTTIARILAKSLNCETGVSAEPCGECSVCQDINAGRFLDLIEVDAASNNGVDNTRELLENSHYAPTSGRFKVYLIDEIHMFSNSSFNALLKTLEEPPAHVKFLLATTETKKLPATILSRCLQFNLKAMPDSLLAKHLEHILTQENIEFEPAALQYVARVAEGSVRDSLSLVEQMVSMGEGAVTSAVVEQMLGILSPQRISELLETVAKGDAAAAMQQVAALDEFAPDYRQMLSDFLSVLHQIAILQLVPGSREVAARWDEAHLLSIAEILTPEQVQLYYDICLQGQQNLPLAPIARDSFEMTLLRLLFFKQAVADPDHPKDPEKLQTAEKSEAPSTVAEQANHADGDSDLQQAMAPASGCNATDHTPNKAPAIPAPSSGSAVQSQADQGVASASLTNACDTQVAVADSSRVAVTLSPTNWLEIVEKLPLRGIAAELAANVGFLDISNDRLSLSIAEIHEDLNRTVERERLQLSLVEFIGHPVRVDIATTAHLNETLSEKRTRLDIEALKSAEASIAADPLVQRLIDRVEGQVEKDSIKPLGSAH